MFVCNNHVLSYFGSFVGIESSVVDSLNYYGVKDIETTDESGKPV
jgi:hypothetical protein